MALLGSPRLIDAIVALAVLEGLTLIGWGRLTGRGMAPRAVVTLLLPGVFLLLALRAALAGAPWPWVPAALAAALVAHLVDLRGRWSGL